jgi:hypothetical protein
VGGWAGWFVLQVFEDGGFVEDSSGGAKLDEVVGEERRYECLVATDDGVEELLFEFFELVFDSHAGFDPMYRIVDFRMSLKLKNTAEW